MQLDTDEDGEPFFKPPAVASAPLRPSNEQPEGNEQHQAQNENETRHSRADGESEQSGAVVAEGV